MLKQQQKQRTVPELPATARKQPGSAAVAEMDDEEGEGEEVSIRRSSAAAPESAPESATEPDSPRPATIGELNKCAVQPSARILVVSILFSRTSRSGHGCGRSS